MSTENAVPFSQRDMAATGARQPKPRTQADTLAAMLSSPKMKAQFQAALPKHMTAERMARIVTTEIRKTPALAKCDQASFLGSVIQCAQLGLEPGNSLGHAYLLPYGSHVQLIIGYRGMIDLARRSGQIISLSARAVREHDEFDYQLGLHEDLIHKPFEGEDAGEITHVYAVAKLQGGGVQFEVMSRAQVEAVRAQSKAGKSGPWVTHFEEMAKKTVIRRLFKYLPVSVEIQRAVVLDERAEAGANQHHEDVLMGEYSIVDDLPESAGEPEASHE